MLPNRYTTSPPMYAPAVTMRKPMIPSAIGIVRSVGFPARRPSDTSNTSSATTMRVEWVVARTRAVPSVFGVIGGAGHGRREHEQDGRDERDVGRRGLADEVEHDDEQERPDRDVGRGGMERVAEPDAVEEILERADRPEEGAEPAVVEIPQRAWPSRPGRR